MGYVYADTSDNHQGIHQYFVGTGRQARSAVFGDALRRYRRPLGLTQEEVAALAGVDVRSVAKLEAGRRPPVRAPARPA
jgi:DNA-binding XRE family transcriptional regulator